MDTDAHGWETAETPLQRFTELLGEDVFFVPCEWGTKRPSLTYVERPFEGTKTEAYRAFFAVEPTNIAVYLGKASGGLCAIDFDVDEDLVRMLANGIGRGLDECEGEALECPSASGEVVAVDFLNDAGVDDHHRFQYRLHVA